MTLDWHWRPRSSNQTVCLSADPPCGTSLMRSLTALSTKTWDASLMTWLGIPIFGSDFWDPHCKWNSNSVFDSEDSGRIFFWIPMSGESENHNSDSEIWNSGTSWENRYLFLRGYQGSWKKTIAIQDGGRIIFPAKPTSTHSYWKTNLHLLTLIRKQAIRVSRCRFGAKIIFPPKPTSTHSYWKMNLHLLTLIGKWAIRVSICRFGAKLCHWQI